MNKKSLLVSLTILIVFTAGYLFGNRHYSVAMTQHRALVDDLEKLQVAFAKQKQRLSQLNITGDVDRATLEHVRKALVTKNEQLFNQGEELELYRKLLKTENAGAALHILDTNIESCSADSQCVYSFVIRRKAGQ